MSSVNLSDPLTVLWQTANPNDRVTLDQIAAEVVLGEFPYSGEVAITLVWLPQPHLICEFRSSAAPATVAIRPAEVTLRLAAYNIEITCGLADLDMENHLRLVLVPKTAIQSPPSADLQYVIFHVPNFRNFTGGSLQARGQLTQAGMLGKLFLTHGDWRVRIDAVANFNELHWKLDLEHGYAITHVGRLERADGKAFSSEQALGQFDGLRTFLSYIRGIHVGPLLLAGHNNAHTPVWKDFMVPPCDPWHPVERWTRQLTPLEIQAVYAGFIPVLNDTDWVDHIQALLEWYLQFVLAKGGVDACLVLEQTALELLAWLHLLERDLLTSEGYGALAAKDRIRLLLGVFSIPIDVPPSLAELHKAMKGMLNASDGPPALTEIRNNIVHPQKKGRDNLYAKFPKSREDAWQLGLWYIELALLNTFHYSGPYFNWLTGAVESVPWHK